MLQPMHLRKKSIFSLILIATLRYLIHNLNK